MSIVQHLLVQLLNPGIYNPAVFETVLKEFSNMPQSDILSAKFQMKNLKAAILPVQDVWKDAGFTNYFKQYRQSNKIETQSDITVNVYVLAAMMADTNNSIAKNMATEVLKLAPKGYDLITISNRAAGVDVKIKYADYKNKNYCPSYLKEEEKVSLMMIMSTSLGESFTQIFKNCRDTEQLYKTCMYRAKYLPEEVMLGSAFLEKFVSRVDFTQNALSFIKRDYYGHVVNDKKNIKKIQVILKELNKLGDSDKLNIYERTNIRNLLQDTKITVSLDTFKDLGNIESFAVENKAYIKPEMELILALALGYKKLPEQTANVITDYIDKAVDLQKDIGMFKYFLKKEKGGIVTNKLLESGYYLDGVVLSPKAKIINEKNKLSASINKGQKTGSFKI